MNLVSDYHRSRLVDGIAPAYHEKLKDGSRRSPLQSELDRLIDRMGTQVLKDMYYTRLPRQSSSYIHTEALRAQHQPRGT